MEFKRMHLPVRSSILLFLLSGLTASGYARKPQLRFPACGVLIENSFMLSAEEAKLRSVPMERVSFLAPVRHNKAAVHRYAVVVSTTAAGIPLDTYTPWWICIKAGEVLEEPTPAVSSYGRLRIDDFEIDQSKLERGQE
jgi:hypothetical protein